MMSVSKRIPLKLVLKLGAAILLSVIGAGVASAGSPLSGLVQRVLPSTDNIAKPPIDDAEFVSQDVPNLIAPGQVVQVSITLENTGTSTWTRAAGYKLGAQNPQDNKTWTGGTRIYLDPSETITPGQRKTFTFKITAPSKPGLYPFQWRMVHEGVRWFGRHSRNVMIRVKVPDDARFVSQSVPSSLQPGQRAQVSITMENIGESTWTRNDGYKLGSQNPQDNKLWTGSTRIYLDPSDSIAPGQRKTFTFEITAPSKPGLYPFQWRMVREGVGWFGQHTRNLMIHVKAPADAVDDAQFLSQSVPSNLQLGQKTQVSITMKNTGSAPWVHAQGYKLGSQNPQDNKMWVGVTRIYLDPSETIEPGQIKTFNFEITAPSEPGIYNFQWRMVHEGIHWFGDVTQNIEIQIGITPEVTQTPEPPPGEFPIRPGLWPASEEEPSNEDLDGDGIPQNLEWELAQWFFPTIWFDDGEDCTAPGGNSHLPPSSPGRLVFRAQPHPDNPEMIAITYALLFRRDCGDNGGLTSHAGDVEPFSITLIPQSICQTGYGIYSIKTWAHEGTIGETTEVKYPLNRCVFGHSSNPTGRNDIVLSAENKHGNYLHDSTCDSALFWAENCDLDFTLGDLNAWVGFNAGERGAQLHNDLDPLGFPGERLWTGMHFCGGLGSRSGCPGAVHTKLDLVAPAPILVPDASFISQSVPNEMKAGASATVSITMRNTGTSFWTKNVGYKLGAQNPPDNERWTGDIRVQLSQDDIIYPDHEKTFTFTMTAPETPGHYDFQWRMVKENVRWFGETTPNVVIHVIPNDDPTTELTPSPTASSTPIITPTFTPEVTPSPTATSPPIITPTSTHEVTPSPTATPTPYISPTPTASIVIWEDDKFDILAIGPLHSQNGWRKGQASAQIIPFEGDGKILEINPNPGTTINMEKNVAKQESGIHRFEFDVMVNGASEPSLAKIEMRTNANTNWDKKFQLYFGSSMRVNYSPSGAATNILPTTQMGRWYHIRCDMDLDSGRMDVWVDGAKVTSGIPMHPGPIVGLSLSGWDRVGSVYLDNLLGSN
jgi:hypothetical protein